MGEEVLAGLMKQKLALNQINGKFNNTDNADKNK
jgi:hypothetical protein